MYTYSHIHIHIHTHTHIHTYIHTAHVGMQKKKEKKKKQPTLCTQMGNECGENIEQSDQGSGACTTLPAAVCLRITERPVPHARNDAMTISHICRNWFRAGVPSPSLTPTTIPHRRTRLCASASRSAGGFTCVSRSTAARYGTRALSVSLSLSSLTRCLGINLARYVVCN